MIYQTPLLLNGKLNGKFDLSSNISYVQSIRTIEYLFVQYMSIFRSWTFSLCCLMLMPLNHKLKGAQFS